MLPAENTVVTSPAETAADRLLQLSRGFPAAVFLVLLCLPAVPQQAAAQWSAGASFEIRDKSPDSGIGFRAERVILAGHSFGFLVADIRLRAHFAYLTEFTDSYRHLEVPVELDAYDYGLSVLAMTGEGFLQPWLGAGLGRETYDARLNGFGSPLLGDRNFHLNGLAGTRFMLHPDISPFAEYRFSKLLGTKGYTHSRHHRFTFGVVVNF